MIQLKIGGVPEHFNLPWQIAIENKAFEKCNMAPQWIDFNGGTGAMNKALREGTIDLAVMLTEGIVYDIANGNSSKIIGQYIQSPLIWGIHTAAQSAINTIDEMYDKKIAISRFGSGSHLMPVIDFNRAGHVIDPAQFVLVRNLDGALHSLTKLESDIFYWEKFITKPFVNENGLKCLGQSPTPWPSFVVVARQEIVTQYESLLQDMIQIVLSVAYHFKANSSSIARISKTYSLSETDALQWLSCTEWSKDGIVLSSTLQQVITALKAAMLVD
jgi:hypothetical protein